MGFDKLNSGAMASNIDDLVDLVSKKQEECESKFWRVSIGGENVVNYRLVGEGGRHCYSVCAAAGESSVVAHQERHAGESWCSQRH